MKYFMIEVKKGEIASQLFNDKQLLLPAKRILLGKKVYVDSFPSAAERGLILKIRMSRVEQ